MSIIDSLCYLLNLSDSFELLPSCFMFCPHCRRNIGQPTTLPVFLPCHVTNVKGMASSLSLCLMNYRKLKEEQVAPNDHFLTWYVIHTFSLSSPLYSRSCALTPLSPFLSPLSLPPSHYHSLLLPLSLSVHSTTCLSRVKHLTWHIGKNN